MSINWNGTGEASPPETPQEPAEQADNANPHPGLRAVSVDLKHATNAELVDYVCERKRTRNCNRSRNDISDVEWELTRRLWDAMEEIKELKMNYMGRWFRTLRRAWKTSWNGRRCCRNVWTTVQDGGNGGHNSNKRSR